MKFERRVYEKEFSLNDTDDSIIEYIKRNRSDIQKISIQKMANELFISPNAIMRLARKIGYSGFAELKYALQNEDSPAQYKTVTSKLFDRIPDNIARTIDIIDDNQIKKMVEKMDKSEKILFAGVGDSSYFCQLFGRYLRCIKKKVEYFQQIHDIEYYADQYTKGDMIVIISASGSIPRLIKLAENVVKNGVYLVSMTHYGENELSRLSDMQICFWGEKRIVNNYNVTDYSGLMVIIRMICEQYWKYFST